MSRTYVVTGSASGIGRATTDLLTERGHRVIGVDVRDADVVADLSTAEGRSVLLITHRPEGLDLVDEVVTLAT